MVKQIAKKQPMSMSSCQPQMELNKEIHYLMSTSSCESGNVSTSSYEHVATTIENLYLSEEEMEWIMSTHDFDSKTTSQPQ